jgi:rare lipoprotein A
MARDSPGAAQSRSRRNFIGGRRSLLPLCAALALAAAPLYAQSQGAPTGSSVRTETGIATVYGMNMQGQPTSSGSPYDPARMSAAHRSLPLGTRVKVINLATEQSVEVVINDRWGGGQGRIINLSDRAAKDVGFGTAGTISVRVEVIELGKGMAYTEPGSAGHARSVASSPVLPAQIRTTDTSSSASGNPCENEAAILGLTGDFMERHLKSCMTRSTARK